MFSTTYTTSQEVCKWLIFQSIFRPKLVETGKYLLKKTYYKSITYNSI